MKRKSRDERKKYLKRQARKKARKADKKKRERETQSKYAQSHTMEGPKRENGFPIPSNLTLIQRALGIRRRFGCK